MTRYREIFIYLEGDKYEREENTYEFPAHYDRWLRFLKSI